MSKTCSLCPHACVLEPGQSGLCRARGNFGGEIVCLNYGRATALALDPIEKKPLRRFYPGSRILSVGSFGCNLRCQFCQNSEISMAGAGRATEPLLPEQLVAKALAMRPMGNIGVCFTYNEPLVGYEYVRDTAKRARAAGLKTVLVTNGYLCAEPFRALLPLIDALNIDLKGFSERFYKLVGGDLETVKNSIRLAAAACHVEVTTLVIPGLNDSAEEMEAEAAWLASVRPDLPLHISRYFPCYQMQDRPATPVETIYRLRDTAAKRLEFVYTGNC